MKIDAQKSDKPQNPQLNILVVIARFIPLIGIMWLPYNRYAKLFAISLFHKWINCNYFNVIFPII